mgnify:CR=1 FL=1
MGLIVEERVQRTGAQIVWECLSCNRFGSDGSGFGTTFHGDKGTLRIGDWGYLAIGLAVAVPGSASRSSVTASYDVRAS